LYVKCCYLNLKAHSTLEIASEPTRRWATW
jgi:hypothetical protein